MHRVLIEFVVDVPHKGIAKDVEKRLAQEHHERMCEVIKSVTGYVPLQFPGQPGILVVSEPVTWSDAAQDWIGPDDDDD
jgi:hypothetical protein